jgi:hypothetical protein
MFNFSSHLTFFMKGSAGNPAETPHEHIDKLLRLFRQVVRIRMIEAILNGVTISHLPPLW